MMSYCIFLLSLLVVLSVANEDELQVQAVTPRLLHIEEPHYDCKNQALIFVDQYGQKACSYSIRSGETRCTDIDQTVGAVVPIAGAHNQYIAGLGSYLAILQWDGVSPLSTYTVLRKEEAKGCDNTTIIFNDGKADVEGRLWIGTEGLRPDQSVVPNQGNLYHYTQRECDLTTDLDRVTISNGLDWNSDNTIMYYIDSGTYRVDRFDFNSKTGEIGNRLSVIDFKSSNIDGMPHGLTIDTDDNLWIACYEGYQVIKVDPRNGTILKTIKLAISQVTDVAWGGPELNTLYVLSSRRGLNKTEQDQQPLAGTVVAINGLKERGRCPNNAVICR